MFVLCDECHNHYDDSYQSPECAGIGGAAVGFTSNSHQQVGTPPITEHRANTAHAWGRHDRKTRATATETAHAATNTPSLVPDAT